MTTYGDISLEELYRAYYEDRCKNGLPNYYKAYLNRVLRHRQYVYTAWLYIVDTLVRLGFINENDTSAITDLIIKHDDSKFQSDEFFPYAKRFNGPRQTLIVKKTFKGSCELHKSRNPHHYETLKDYEGSDWKYYAVELICDYIAMGWEFGNYVWEYFQTVKERLRNSLPQNYYNFIESIINIIPAYLPLAEQTPDIEYIYYRFNNPTSSDYGIKM